mgnify:FL=1
MMLIDRLARIEYIWSEYHPNVPWYNAPYGVVFPDRIGEVYAIRLISNQPIMSDLKLITLDGLPLNSQDFSHVEAQGCTLQIFLTKPALLAGAVVISDPPSKKMHHDIVIDALTTDQKWHRVSNTAQDRAQLVRDIAADMKKYNEPEEDLQDVYFICAFLLGDFSVAQQIYDSNAVLQKYRENLNRILHRFHREMTGHGIKRSFRFWSNPEKNSYLEEAKKVVDVLKTLSPLVSVGFGTVLGHEREDDLIKHDDDIDILIAFTVKDVLSLSEGLKLCKDRLTEAGYDCPLSFFSHHWVKLSNSLTLDIFVGLIEEDNNLGFYPSARRGLAANVLFPTIEKNLLGVPLPFPQDSQKYLEVIYGSDWRSPDACFRHPWDRSQYHDLVGERSERVATTRGELIKHHLVAS